MSGISERSALDFVLRFTGAGWLEADISDVVSCATVRASYLSDAVLDLVTAVHGVATGAREATCVWHVEPGQSEWAFRRDGGNVIIRVWSSPASVDAPTSDRSTAAQFVLVFQTVQPVPAALLSIADGVSDALTEFGSGEYGEQWGDAGSVRVLLDATEQALAVGGFPGDAPGRPGGGAAAGALRGTRHDVLHDGPVDTGSTT